MPAERSSVLFHIPARGISRRALREFADKLQFVITAGRAFGVLLADDAELQRLNRKFRKQDYATDVLSFPSGKTGAAGYLGDVAVSLDRARAQATEHGHSPDDEIRILMLHGVLHLMGMDHENDDGRMARAEHKWRKHFALPDGLIERVGA
jgi:probable rRNA maturation factor